MDRELLLNRYVSGLKLVSIVYALLQLLVVFTNLLLPTAATEFGRFAYPTLFLIMFLGNSAIGLTANSKNYKYLLPLSILLLLIMYIGVNVIQVMDTDPVLFSSNLGRFMDYQFSIGIMFIVVSVLYLRFYLTTALGIIFSLIVYYQAFSGMSLAPVYFSFDVNEIFSDGLAINTQWFVLLATFVLFSAIVVSVTSWQFDKLTQQASGFERANLQLGRYFSPEVKDEIEKANLDAFENREKESLVAVLFTDINSFTKITEELEPSEVLKLVSEYQSKMVAAIFSSGGTVDKFIGDAVMATFGTPTTRGNDAQNAFECARKMQISMRQWAKEREDLGLTVLSHRIGVHFGPCIIGNVGGEQRVEFTVLGDTVNVASRLCDLCKELGAEVLVSEDLANRLSEQISSDTIEKVEIRGRKEKLKVHRVSF